MKILEACVLLIRKNGKHFQDFCEQNVLFVNFFPNTAKIWERFPYPNSRQVRRGKGEPPGFTALLVKVLQIIFANWQI